MLGGEIEWRANFIGRESKTHSSDQIASAKRSVARLRLRQRGTDWAGPFENKFRKRSRLLACHVLSQLLTGLDRRQYANLFDRDGRLDGHGTARMLASTSATAARGLGQVTMMAVLVSEMMPVVMNVPECMQSIAQHAHRAISGEQNECCDSSESECM